MRSAVKYGIWAVAALISLGAIASAFDFMRVAVAAMGKGYHGLHANELAVFIRQSVNSEQASALLGALRFGNYVPFLLGYGIHSLSALLLVAALVLLGKWVGNSPHNPVLGKVILLLCFTVGFLTLIEDEWLSRLTFQYFGFFFHHGEIYDNFPDPTGWWVTLLCYGLIPIALYQVGVQWGLRGRVEKLENEVAGIV